MQKIDFMPITAPDLPFTIYRFYSEILLRKSSFFFAPSYCSFFNEIKFRFSSFVRSLSFVWENILREPVKG